MKKILIFALAAALAATFAVPAFAGYTVKMGARVNQEIGWSFTSKEQTVNGKDDVTNSFVNLVGNSYLRAKFMSDDKKVGAHIEIGMKEGSNIGTRHAYAWYRLGRCTFLAGQTDNWQGGKGIYWASQKLAEGPTGGDVLGWGKAWVPRQPKVQWTWHSGTFGFQAALEKQRTMPASGIDTSGSDLYSMWPSVSLAFDYTNKSFEITPSFIWTQWQMEGAPAGYDDTVYAYGFIVPIAVKAGGFKLILEGHYSQNPAGLYSGYSTYGKAMYKADGKLENATVYGGYGEVSYVTGALRIALGGGFENFKNDAWKSESGYKDDSTSRYMGWVALPYQAHKYLTIRPELDYYNYGDDPQTSDSAGSEWVIGVLFRFVF